MSSELVNPVSNEAQLATLTQQTSKYATPDVINDLVTSGGWLPYLSVCTGNTKLVMDGKARPREYVLVQSKDQFESLGDSCVVKPYAYRPKAMKFSQGGGAPTSYFDPKSDDFNRVRELSSQQNSGCAFGLEFLIWVPDKKKFATFFWKGTARRESQSMILALQENKACSMGSKSVTSGKNTWINPVATVNETPIVNLPDFETAKTQVEKFNNPPESSVEFDPETMAKEGEEVRG